MMAVIKEAPSQRPCRARCRAPLAQRLIEDARGAVNRRSLQLKSEQGATGEGSQLICLNLSKMQE
jgi:hypothetical protein